MWTACSTCIGWAFMFSYWRTSRVEFGVRVGFGAVAARNAVEFMMHFVYLARHDEALNALKDVALKTTKPNMPGVDTGAQWNRSNERIL